jgi:hypothetical protein
MVLISGVSVALFPPTSPLIALQTLRSSQADIRVSASDDKSDGDARLNQMREKPALGRKLPTTGDVTSRGGRLSRGNPPELCGPNCSDRPPLVTAPSKSSRHPKKFSASNDSGTASLSVPTALRSL